MPERTGQLSGEQRAMLPAWQGGEMEQAGEGMSGAARLGRCSEH